MSLCCTYNKQNFSHSSSSFFSAQTRKPTGQERSRTDFSSFFFFPRNLVSWLPLSSSQCFRSQQRWAQRKKDLREKALSCMADSLGTDAQLLALSGMPFLYFLEISPQHPLSREMPLLGLANFPSPFTSWCSGFYFTQITSLGIPLFSRKVILLSKVPLTGSQACVFPKVSKDCLARGKIYASLLHSLSKYSSLAILPFFVCFCLLLGAKIPKDTHGLSEWFSWSPCVVNAHPPLQGIGGGGGYTQPTISYPHWLSFRLLTLLSLFPLACSETEAFSTPRTVSKAVLFSPLIQDFGVWWVI